MLERRRRSQGGAAAIEFVLVFPFFLALLYSFITYGLIFALQQSMVVAAEDAARASVACDPALEDEHEDCVIARARQAAGVALAWLPEAQRALILGSDNQNVVVELDSASDPPTVTVQVEYPNYASSPILPVMKLTVLSHMGWAGSIPPVPSELVARSVVSL